MAQTSSVHPYVWSMAVVHKIYRDALASGPVLVESARGDAHRRVLIASYYTNVLASVESHHGAEDVCLLPLLGDRAAEHRDAVESSRAEHRQVVTRLAEAQRASASWASKGDPGAEGLISVLGSLDEAVSVHLDHEEAVIVPLAIKHVTAEEWGKIAVHGAAHFAGDKFWLIVGLNLENRTEPQRAAMLENFTPERREWWDNVGAPSFEHMIAEVRHAG